MRRYAVAIDGKSYVIDIKEMDAGRFQVHVGAKTFVVELSAEEDIAEAVIRPEIMAEGEGETALAGSAPPPPIQLPKPDTLPILPSTPQPPLPEHRPAPGENAQTELHAPMPGTILSVAVKPGEAVTRGQTLMVLEAMKMKNPLRAPRDAVVAELLVQPGQTVGYGHALLRFREG